MRSVDHLRRMRTRPHLARRAFASQEAKNAWGDTGDIETPADAEPSEFEFRVGGRERFTVRVEGSIFRYDVLYYDIVPDRRIVYSYEMYAGAARISVSVATIEFAKSGDGPANLDRARRLPGRHRRAAGPRAAQGRHDRNAGRPDPVPDGAADELTGRR
ncbi:MAG TPA: SRPBCC domain-containing protein [Streptosporangiaceae bacterium]|nr:SRPBCC domain-containing protein [Streptosporangiaceae bacterium]